jgi:hypothetical protein
MFPYFILKNHFRALKSQTSFSNFGNTSLEPNKKYCVTQKKNNKDLLGNLTILQWVTLSMFQMSQNSFC